MRRILVAILALACVCALAGCGGDPLPPERPRTAKAKAKGAKVKGAKHGSEAKREAADPDQVSGDGKDWGGWRYQGSRDDCFYLVARRCFTEQKAACKAAKCGKKQCVADGGGPATMRCR
jgi:hypothetical protein